MSDTPEPRAWTLRINPDGVGIVGGWAEGDIPGFQGEMVEVIEKSAYDAAVELLRGLAVTTCREWVENDRCNAPAEFVLWGKLIDPEGLGPRCYDHAAKWVDHRGLGDPSYAIIDLRPARAFLATQEKP